MVKINHTKKSLKSRFIHGQRKISDGGGVLVQMMKTSTGESVAKELGLRQRELTLVQANHQAMGAAQLQDVTETRISFKSSWIFFGAERKDTDLNTG